MKRFKSFSLRLHDGRLACFDRPAVMAIINVTPDSFYEASRTQSHDDIKRAARQMIDNGADILDLGAYSTRPGADDVNPGEEMDRMLRGIRAVREVDDRIPLSADTFRASVAAAALDAGADIINDISGGERDAAMFDLVASRDVPYVLMHSRGTPADMGSLTDYRNVTVEVVQWLAERLRRLRLMGAGQVIVDPGFGFAKTTDQNYRLLSELELLDELGAPVLAGISRKSMIYKLLDITPAEALNGTTVLNTIALERGASILRVHDPREAVETIKILQHLNG